MHLLLDTVVQRQLLSVTAKRHLHAAGRLEKKPVCRVQNSSVVDTMGEVNFG